MTYFILTNTDGIYTNSIGTTATDYFEDWLRSSTTTATFTTYNPYTQAYTIPYDYTGREGIHFQRGQEQHRCQEEHQRQEEHHSIPRQHLQQKSPEQIKEEKNAIERAKTLLLENLDEDNRKKFLDKKNLEISSKLFDEIKYQVPLSKFGRIKAWKENRIITELCLVVEESEQLPTEDVILAKLLHILHDEKNMLETANHSNVKEDLLAKIN